MRQRFNLKNPSRVWALASRSLLVTAILVTTTVAQAVGTRRIALRDADDFKGGEFVGVALDSTGRVSTGFNLGEIGVQESAVVWTALRTSSGSTLLATAPEGKLFEYKGGVVKEVAKADAMVLTSLVEAWNGTVLVGSLPGGTLFEYSGGELKPWLKVEGAEHIFDLAYDAKEGAVFAATGPEGKLFRITRDKKAQVYLDLELQHLMSVAVGQGRVYTGGGDQARLYEVTGPGRATVLFDFGRTEVRDIAVGKMGDVFAIANEIKARQFPSGSKPSDSKASKSRASAGKGTLYRFSPGKAPEMLLDDDSQHYVSLALDAQDRPYVGTGVEGRVYTASENRNSILVADTEAGQVTSLVFGKGEQLVIGSDPATIYPIRDIGGPGATWTGKVIDLGIRARFGQLDWLGAGELEFSSRSGNTSEPDDTWTAWSAGIKRPGPLTSPAARYVQLRAAFLEPTSTLTEVSFAFVTDNLPAVIKDITLESPGDDVQAPDGKMRASGGPISGKPQAEIELKWEVDNPDKDDLSFTLQYQLVGTSHWFDILEPGEKLTKASYSWDTSELPEGRYLVRVAVSDDLANPPDRVKRHSLTSHTVVVDNTPPELLNLKLANNILTGTAVDGVGPITRVEVARTGTDDWIPLDAKDGVFDESREDFEGDISSLMPRGAAMLTVRVFDTQKNRVVRSLLTK